MGETEMDRFLEMEEFKSVYSRPNSIDSLASSRSLRTMASCSTMEKWRSLSYDQKIKWVKLTVECECGLEEEYIDLINKLGEIK